VQTSLTLSTLVRYAALGIALAIAVRSLVRMMMRSISVAPLLQALTKLAAAQQFERAARLVSVVPHASVARLVVRALSLRIAARVSLPGEDGHFRDGGAIEEPFERRWDRAMDAAQQGLRRSVMTDLIAALVGFGSVTALGALSATLSRDEDWQKVGGGLAIAAFVGAVIALRTGLATLRGLVTTRAFCDSIRQPLEQMSEDRRRAASIAEGVWRAHAEPASGDGIDP
jgi:hypothetical protein